MSNILGHVTYLSNSNMHMRLGAKLCDVHVLCIVYRFSTTMQIHVCGILGLSGVDVLLLGNRWMCVCRVNTAMCWENDPGMTIFSRFPKGGVHSCTRPIPLLARMYQHCQSPLVCIPRKDIITHFILCTYTTCITYTHVCTCMYTNNIGLCYVLGSVLVLHLMSYVMY